MLFYFPKKIKLPVYLPLKVEFYHNDNHLLLETSRICSTLSSKSQYYEFNLSYSKSPRWRPNWLSINLDGKDNSVLTIEAPILMDSRKSDRHYYLTPHYSVEVLSDRLILNFRNNEKKSL